MRDVTPIRSDFANRVMSQLRRYNSGPTYKKYEVISCPRCAAWRLWEATLNVIRQHTSAYVSIRQHTSAYVSIRQHTSAYVYGKRLCNRVTYADECWRMLTYAEVCWRMLKYAGVCWRMLTYADVCWRMLTYADVWRLREATLQQRVMRQLRKLNS
jgi:hypothetical protein